MVAEVSDRGGPGRSPRPAAAGGPRAWVSASTELDSVCGIEPEAAAPERRKARPPAAGTDDQRRARRTSATAHARQALGARPMSHRAGAIWASGWDGAEAQRGVAADG
jgi:hypothetical protein